MFSEFNRPAQAQYNNVDITATVHQWDTRKEDSKDKQALANTVISYRNHEDITVDIVESVTVSQLSNKDLTIRPFHRTTEYKHDSHCEILASCFRLHQDDLRQSCFTSDTRRTSPTK